jgi:hypothetical protein
MIPGSGTIADYSSFISNCTKKQFAYRIPVNSLADVQLFIDIGAVKPVTASYQLIHTCDGGTVETISPLSYVIGQDKNNSWYGVFKNFVSVSPLSCFVIAITLDSAIYFSEEYCVETCSDVLTEIKGCYGNLDPLLSRDCNGVYFGYHAGLGDPLGDTAVRYEHKLLIRNAELSVSAIKNTFKQGLIRNFRTEKEKIFQFLAEFIPEWYLDEVDAVFTRGEIFIDAIKYLVNETEYEKIEDCKRMWKPTVSLKESCYKSFSCELDPCAAPPTVCCDPEITDVTVEEVIIESGFIESGESGTTAGTVSGVVVIELVVDRPPVVTGTFALVTGGTNGSSVITSDALRNARVYVERGNVFNPGINPFDGSQYHTKVFSDNFITFSTPLVSGEFIYIETIPGGVTTALT